MEDNAEIRFRDLLRAAPDPQGAPPTLTPAHAAKLLARTANVPFFAHTYTFYHNMIHGTISRRCRALRL